MLHKIHPQRTKSQKNNFPAQNCYTFTHVIVLLKISWWAFTRAMHERLSSYFLFILFQHIRHR